MFFCTKAKLEQDFAKRVHNIKTADDLETFYNGYVKSQTRDVDVSEYVSARLMENGLVKNGLKAFVTEREIELFKKIMERLKEVVGDKDRLSDEAKAAIKDDLEELVEAHAAPDLKDVGRHDFGNSFGSSSD